MAINPILVSDPPPLSNPPIKKCTIISTNITDASTGVSFLNNEGNARIFQKVLVKNGIISTFDHIYHTLNDEDDSNDEDRNESEVGSNDKNKSDESNRAYLLLEDNEICGAIYGNVYYGRVLRRQNATSEWELTEEWCAIKAMKWKKIKDGLINRTRLENPRTEIATMHHFRSVYNAGAPDRAAHSPNEVMRKTNVMVPLDALFTDDSLYIVMPLCNSGDLIRITEQGFTENMEKLCRTLIVPQILNALHWLREAKLCHRDISLENFALHRERGDVKVVLIDFGVALQIPYMEDGTRQLISPQSPAGKPPYMSPEIYKREPFDGHAVDLWHVSVIIYALILGQYPWETPLDMLRKMNKRRLDAVGPGISNNALLLLQSMLQLDPRKRLTLEQILAHPWLQVNT